MARLREVLPQPKAKPLLENRNYNKYDVLGPKPETPGPNMMRKPFLGPAKEQIQQRVMTPKENNKLNALQRVPGRDLEFRRQPSAPQVFQKNNNLQEKEDMLIFQEAQRKIQEYRRESQERRKRLESAERLKPEVIERNRIASVDKKLMHDKYGSKEDQDFKCPAINEKPKAFNPEAFNQKMKERDQERQKKKQERFRVLADNKVAPPPPPPPSCSS